ncbi:zinc finger protein, putative [Ixodes scapularis]|uniref:Zinc finger protein, putative n=1 Tax=Ixodes scapularis TaxID=6945 RepID=B7P4Y3_IXOSC|nr:zinc finger protein, putative [Ixodes scapularis]|eukprot:XP_002406595.1 zinc finger protein, putative [Ixodes scapularis]
MENWDEAKLAEVVEQKHGEAERRMPKTDIRAKLGSNLARITLESFLAWKKAKIQERQATEQKERDRKRDEFKAGRNMGLSGRDMFTFRPELADDDQNEEDEEAYDLTRFGGEEDSTQVRYPRCFLCDMNPR